MSRFRIALALVAVAVATAALLPATTPATTTKHARATKPTIKAAEVGYFGTGLVAHQLSVFVYSRSQPGGTKVKICVNGVCKPAQGHRASTAWYTASFSTAPLHMGDPVTFSATVANSAGRAKLKVTKPLLCMHNDGSTPQKS